MFLASRGTRPHWWCMPGKQSWKTGQISNSKYLRHAADQGNTCCAVKTWFIARKPDYSQNFAIVQRWLKLRSEGEPLVWTKAPSCSYRLTLDRTWRTTPHRNRRQIVALLSFDNDVVQFWNEQLSCLCVSSTSQRNFSATPVISLSDCLSRRLLESTNSSTGINSAGTQVHSAQSNLCHSSGIKSW
jgi:hypothetical protein